jgi:PHD/YefM family antitoxin component YafN of YafNO toxin-antitoxin module
MAGLEALQAVQFVTKNGKRFAVLSAEDWEALVEWLETVEDAQIARQAFAQLRAAKGNRSRAGWRKWSEVEGELG